MPSLLTNESAVFSTNGGGEAIASGGSARDAIPGYYDINNTTDVSRSGWFAFRGGLRTVSGVGPEVGVYRTNVITGKTTLRVKTNDKYGQITSTTADNNGNVAFSARHVPGYSNDDGILFIIDGKNKVTMVGLAGGTRFEQLSINNSDTVAAIVDGGGVAAYNGGQGVQVGWNGMTIGGCAVADATIGPHAINASGQIAMQLSCYANKFQAYEMNVVATPIP